MAAKKTSFKERSATSRAKPLLKEGNQSDEDSIDHIKTATKSKTKNRDVRKEKTGSRKIVTNVIYIGHLPKHCEERELIGFLKQFGILTQLRLCRSHKTGGPKGYAFAKFQDPDVAAIVAETLNGYLLFQKQLVSHVLAPEQIHRKLFASKTRTVFQRKTVKPGGQVPGKMDEISKRLIEREQKKRDKLQEVGIDYEFPGYEGSKNKQDREDESNDGIEQEVEHSVKKSKKTEGSSSAKSSPQKRKHSFDEDKDAPLASTMGSDKPQSEKKKKKKKKDKKRRKSVS